MIVSAEAANQGRIIMEYMSPKGTSVTHLRGTVIMNSLEILKHAGHFERYLSLLAAQHRDTLLYTLASSWVPVDVAAAHYEACDRLELSDHELSVTGELTAKRVAETFLGTVLRTSRKAGVESYWFVVRQSDRLWERGFQGGGCTVIQTGPKDVIVEWHGLPLVTSRHFRVCQRYYSRALALLFCNVAFVKTVRPREPHPHRLATAVSWV